jgi:protein SCO1/2
MPEVPPMRAGLVTGWIAAAAALGAGGQSGPVGVEEKLGQTLPLAELSFTGEDGAPAALKDLVDRPTVVLFVFLRCAGICTPLLQEVARVADLAALEPGKDYRILTVSFDPKDTPELARRRKDAVLGTMKRRPCPPDGWRFLTGTPDAIRRATDAAGFRYEAVEGGQSFNHPAVVTFVDRTGKIVRYLYGTQMNPADLELALGDASTGTPRSIIQSVRQACYAYDPGKGYVFRVNRVILAVTVLFAAGFGLFLLLRGRRRTAGGNAA